MDLKSAEASVLPYERQLDEDLRWALCEGSRHFEEKSLVFEALHKIVRRLQALAIPYAVAGEVAMFKHGLRRFTEIVEILVTNADLLTIHRNLVGNGYWPTSAMSKNLRDNELGIKIEFLVAGEFPGDCKKKPISFPDPRTVAMKSDDIAYINLQKLVELKLASGITGTGRRKDLTDVLELIKMVNLPLELAFQLDVSVRDQYKELWYEARKRYVLLWRNKWLASGGKTIRDMASSLRAAAEELDRMRIDGVILEDTEGRADGYGRLVTTDRAVADKYGFVDEAEYWNRDEDERD